MSRSLPTRQPHRWLRRRPQPGLPAVIICGQPGPVAHIGWAVNQQDLGLGCVLVTPVSLWSPQTPFHGKEPAISFPLWTRRATVPTLQSSTSIHQDIHDQERQSNNPERADFFRNGTVHASLHDRRTIPMTGTLMQMNGARLGHDRR